MEQSCRKVCVTGGSGYIGSWLVKKLLEKGYRVHATLRNLNDEMKVGLLKSFPNADERLVLFEADIYNAEDFQPAIEGCDSVLHVATPMQHTENDKYKNTTEAAIEGVKRIALSCIRSGTVKRLVYTASVVSASPMKDDISDYKDFVDETCWTPLDHIYACSNDSFQGYLESKTLAEKEILRYGECQFGVLEVVSLVCGLVGGDTHLHYTPQSVSTCVSPITGNELGYHGLKFLEDLLGKIPVVHINDVCEAHIFCIEHPSINGRFLCASAFLSCAEIVQFYKENYPSQYRPNEVYMDAAKKDIMWGSTKLTDQGFQYKYDANDIFNDSVKCARRIGDLF